MPSIRLMLWGALGALLLLNYEAWMHDYEPAAATAAQSSAAPAGATAPPSSLGQTVPNSVTSTPRLQHRRLPVPRRPPRRPAQ